MNKFADKRKPTVPDGEGIMRVVSLRGSNLVEVMDAAGEKSLALIPAKFQKNMWIKRGNFVLVDETGREQALESHAWPRIFRSTPIKTSTANAAMATIESEQKESCGVGDNDGEDSDNGLPPLEANMNRVGMPDWRPDTESDSDSELTS
uniref:S1-like domain-containing protein n=1 Tax=Kalanchoe fedtschenkoi TaxID=63787 RepID=A0A7N0VKB7_KALFE